MLERLAEKLVIKCMDEKAAALRESLGKIYEMTDRGVESRYVTFLDTNKSYFTLISTNRSKQKRRVLLFDMLRLLLCMSRQPAIWKNRRQGLNKESRKIKTNEEDKNKLDRFVDGDYETWTEEFKNDNFEDELYFENDDDDVEEEEQKQQFEDKDDQNDETETEVVVDRFKHLPPLARLPFEHNNNILFDDSKDAHFHSSSQGRSPPPQHRHQSNEFRATELQNRLRDSVETRAAQKCGFAKDTSLVRLSININMLFKTTLKHKQTQVSQWASQQFNRSQCSEPQVVWQTLQALQGIPGLIFVKKDQETFDLCDSSKMPVLKHTSITALRSTLRHILEHINLVATMRHRIRVVMSSALQSVGHSKGTCGVRSRR